MFTLVLRIKDPSRFGKLEAMKKTWGEKGGTAVHVFGYTVAPIVGGGLLLFFGLGGSMP